MSKKKRQAQAYLDEARKTLEGAWILFKHRNGGYAQIVKNAYDSLEQAMQSAIAFQEEEIPRNHPGKFQKFFQLYKNERLEEEVSRWMSKRQKAQYVDFKGEELSIPADNFNRGDAEEIIELASQVIDFVEQNTELD